MDTTESTKMNDANGGTGILTGMVENVRLDFGGVSTRANLYVGEHVPFDLLLGRPWQRGNYVSIDELEDGTYLIFKDPRTLQPKYSVLVTPDGVNLKWDYEPASWVANGLPVSYLINLEKEAGIREESDDLDRPELVKEELILEDVDQLTNKELTQDMRNPPGEILDQLDLEGEKDIKPGVGESREPSISFFLHTPYSMSTPSIILTRSEEDSSVIEPNMEMWLMPARIRHENELASLSSQFRTQTDAERFLTRLSDPDRPPNLQLRRDMVLSTRDGLVIAL